MLHICLASISALPEKERNITLPAASNVLNLELWYSAGISTDNLKEHREIQCPTTFTFTFLLSVLELSGVPEAGMQIRSYDAKILKEAAKVNFY